MRLWDRQRLRRRLGKRAGEKWGQASGVGAGGGGGSTEKTAVWKEMQSTREHSCCEFGRVETSPKGTFRGAVYQSAQEP